MRLSDGPLIVISSTRCSKTLRECLPFRWLQSAACVPRASTRRGNGSDHHIGLGVTSVRAGPDRPDKRHRDLREEEVGPTVVDVEFRRAGAPGARCDFRRGCEAPHFHPTDEHVTVLKGSFSIGMGDAVDKAHALTLSAGGTPSRLRTCITMRIRKRAQRCRCTCKGRLRSPT